MTDAAAPQPEPPEIKPCPCKSSSCAPGAKVISIPTRAGHLIEYVACTTCGSVRPRFAP